MNWQVEFSKKASKQITKLSGRVRDALAALVLEIQLAGPVRGNWKNYSKLADGAHHCHLDYRHVACWRVVDLKNPTVEVYYVGSRENAPY